MNTIKYLFLSLAIMLSTQSFGQQLTSPGIYKVNFIDYKILPKTESGGIIIIRNNRIKLPDNIYLYNNIDLKIIDIKVTNRNDYVQIINSALGAATLSKLKNAKEELGLYFHFSTNGKIINLYFSVITDILTLTDIANLDKALREKYTAKITSIQNLHQHMRWIDSNDRIDFSKL